MRIVAATLFLIVFCSTPSESWSQTSCKACADQQKACRANCVAATCKKEYDIWMEGRKKQGSAFATRNRGSALTFCSTHVNTR